ncbi:MAG TPA: AraC family transcriptional regulator [Chitinophagaceae bacterium]|nr:AraC family transcriptional regulator [Chitinophagaceae bacterium]
MIQYRYQQGDLVEWQENLAKLLGVEKKYNYFIVPQEVGKGIFYASPLLNGMGLLYVNVIFHQDFTFDRQPSKDAGIMLYFNQVEIANEYKVISGEQMVIDHNKKRNTTFLGSSQFPWQLCYDSGTHLRAIAIRFNEKLVRTSMKEDQYFQIQSYISQNLANANKEELTPELMKLLNEIYQSDISTMLGQLILQNRALLLVEKFLHNFFLQWFPDSKNVRINKSDMERLAMIEDLLSSESDNFPTIEKLSKMAMMSSTKLKKRFKEVYGMKLYEYFNHNRLQKARNMLETGEASVKEAAIEIGFANLSNFSKAFKKEFGFLPKQLKKAQEQSHLMS